MSYVTTSEVETRMGATTLVQLTDDTGTGVANTDVVDEACQGAAGEVDSYLARRCAVPIDLMTHAELAAIIKTVVLDLAEHRLHARRPPVPADVTAKRDAAVQWLLRVAAGDIELPASRVVQVNPATGFRAAATGDDRVLSRGEMDGF
jgi:phage gp36-like protein